MDYSGQRFDQYQLLEQLGQGGMATVYKAFDTRLERDVAIKIVRKESIPPEQLERIMKRFEREAKALAKFIHPNIVPVHDFGDYKGAPYLVMAYLPGGTLKDRIGSPVPVQQALNWVIPIASALSFAHQRGVVHRDVKPSNILTTEDGTLMLSDFGIAQILEESTTQLTATGMGVGTPEYMAPEQWQGRADAASDQYALGVVLYELLTGRKPFSAETPLAVALKVMSDPLPPPSGLVAGIPEAVEKVLYKALARAPKDRYEDMASFRQALTHVKEGAVASAPSAQQPETPVSIAQPAMESETIDEVEVDLSEEEDFNESALSAREIERLKTMDDLATRFPGTTTTASKPEVVEKDQDSIEVIDILKDSSIDQPKKKIGSWYVILLFSVLGIIVITLMARMQANTKKMELTSATARAQSIATVNAQSTATAQSAFDSYFDFINSASLIYSKKAGSLTHVDDGYLENYWIDVDTKNFALEVTFEVPYDQSIGDWSSGVLFRNSGSDSQYRLYITSDDRWFIKNREGSTISSDSGYLDVNLNEDDENHFQILVNEKDGAFFLNGEFISELNLSERINLGGIALAIDFQGNNIEGYSTPFKDLSVYTPSNRITNTKEPAESTRVQETPTKSIEPITIDKKLHINVEEKGGMNYFHVIAAGQGIDYLTGPISSSKISDYKLAISPSNKCFAYIVGQIVYYGIVGDNSIYIAGDISNFSIIQKGGSGESDYIELSWPNRNNWIHIKDLSTTGTLDSRTYEVFTIGTFNQCYDWED